MLRVEGAAGTRLALKGYGDLQPHNQETASTTEFSPLVSVITPVLNGKKYLERCIQSVLSQSYANTEHVFADGGSSDGTLDILRSYSEHYPRRIRFITGTDKNAEDAWNKAVILSKGDILGWLGADDTYTPGALRIVVDFFKSNPGASFVYGICNVIDADDRLIRQLGTRDFELGQALNDECQIPTPAAFYKREVIARVGLLNTKLPPGDFEYWLRIAQAFQIYRTPHLLANFRLHSGSTSGSAGTEKRYAYVDYKISRRYGGRVLSRRGQRYFKLVLRDLSGPVYNWLKWLIKRPSADKR